MHAPSIALSLLIWSAVAVATSSSVAFSQHHSVFHEHDELGMSLAGTSQQPLLASPTLKSRPTTVYRPRSQAALERARLRSLRYEESEEVEWDLVNTQGPDVQDKHTLSQLARMTSNAYALPGKGWFDIDPIWNMVSSLSMHDVVYPTSEADSKFRAILLAGKKTKVCAFTPIVFFFELTCRTDGFRGHAFVATDESTVVLAIKGTTLTGITSKKDKFNDNLLFSCCCAWVDITWAFSTVCKCHEKSYRCDSTCLSDALIQDSLFYLVGVVCVLSFQYDHSSELQPSRRLSIM